MKFEAEIPAAIERWSESYPQLEQLQKDEAQTLLPKHSDQMTGMIGEFWGMLYLKNQNKSKTLVPRFMGYVQSELAEEGQTVQGVIID